MERQQEKHIENGGSEKYPFNPNASFKERMKNPDHRRKCLYTIWIGASFLGLGFAIGQRGPAFLDLQIITQTNVEAASYFFTSSSVGYLAGSLAAGVAYDKMNKPLLMLFCVLGMGVTTIALPWCSIYGLMITIHFLVSLFGGGIDTVVNAELVRTWGTKGEMAMQATHFAFAFGGVIGPLATEPFLTPNPVEDQPAANVSYSTLNASVTIGTSNATANSTAFALPTTTIVHYAYMISGGIILLTAIPLAIQLYTEGSESKRHTASHKKTTVKQPLPTPLFLLVLSLLCLFYFLYCSVEDTFAAYLSTFVVTQLRWSKSSGAQVTSVHWASFSAGRFLCIFVVKFLRSTKLLVLCCFSLLVSFLAFLVLSQYGVTVGVWLATFMAGFSMSAIFPTGFTWMEEELVRVTGRVASSIMIASSSGTMVNPIVLGYLMEQLTPMWFSYLLFGESLLCLAVFLLLLSLSRLYLKNYYVIPGRRTDEILISAGLDGAV